VRKRHIRKKKWVSPPAVDSEDSLAVANLFFRLRAKYGKETARRMLMAWGRGKQKAHVRLERQMALVTRLLEIPGDQNINELARRIVAANKQTYERELEAAKQDLVAHRKMVVPSRGADADAADLVDYDREIRGRGTNIDTVKRRITDALAAVRKYQTDVGDSIVLHRGTGNRGPHYRYGVRCREVLGDSI
jgi:hypothetical protein